MKPMEFGITSTKEYEPPPQDDHALYRVKGMLTKFMRMIFPLEFRIDSMPNSGATLPFHYPLVGGEMIYLPETVAGIGGAEMARDYFVLTAAHLAGRHEFGTFDFQLASMPGFEERSEAGVEAIDGYVASFDDPALAGALMRLCESARIDAEICRRYSGLTTRVTRMHAVLAENLRPEALSTLLVKAALDVTLGQDDPAGGFIQRAESFFAPLRVAGATVTQSALQTGALFQWLQELMAAARAAGEGDLGGRSASDMRDDLLGQMRGPGQSGDGLGDGEGDGDGEDGETDDQITMDSAGSKSRGKGGRPLTPEQIRKLLEAGAQLKPSQGPGSAEGEGMYLTQLFGKDSQELEQLREQLGEIGTMPGAGRLILGRNRSADSYYAYDEWDYVAADYRRNWCRLREILLDGDNGDFFAATLERYAEVLPQVRRHFQKIRPASYRMVRGLEDGDEIDVDRT